MRLRKSAVMATMLLLLIIIFTGCGSSQKAVDETAVSTAFENELELTTINNGTLTIATNALFPPYEYYDGNDIVGIDVDVAKAIASHLGLELKIEDMEFDSVFTAVESKKADMGISGMTETDDKQKFVHFTKPYITCIQSVIVKEGSKIQSIEDLNGKKIGVQLSTIGDIYAVNDYGSENVVEYNKGMDAVKALLSDKIDCVIIDKAMAELFAADYPGIQILDDSYSVENYAACVSKENKALQAALDQAIEELQKDGTIQGIINKYIVGDYRQ